MSAEGKSTGFSFVYVLKGDKSMLQTISLKCPDCDAGLDVEEGRDSYFCPYCGRKIVLYDTNKTVQEKIYRDESKIRESDNKTSVELEKLKIQNEKDKRSSIVILIMFIAFILFIVYVSLIP